MKKQTREEMDRTVTPGNKHPFAILFNKGVKYADFNNCMLVILSLLWHEEG